MVPAAPVVIAKDLVRVILVIDRRVWSDARPMSIYIEEISRQPREPYNFLKVLRSDSKSSTRAAQMFTISLGALLSTTAPINNMNEPGKLAGDIHPNRLALNAANYFSS